MKWSERPFDLAPSGKCGQELDELFNEMAMKSHVVAQLCSNEMASTACVVVIIMVMDRFIEDGRDNALQDNAEVEVGIRLDLHRCTGPDSLRIYFNGYLLVTVFNDLGLIRDH